MTIFSNKVLHLALMMKALDDSDVDNAASCRHATNNLADELRRHPQKHTQPLTPLVQQLTPMNQYECIHPALGDKFRCYDSLSESCGRAQNSLVVVESFFNRL